MHALRSAVPRAALAAAIRPRRTLPLALLLPAALLLSACTDHPAEPSIRAPDGEVSRTRVECTVQVQSEQVSCAMPPAGGPSANLILGGQHVYLRLISANASYAAGVFSFDVVVQNLLSQRMGTPDGSTVYGMKVLFDAGPTATGGSGAITVANPDGYGTFTGSNQPYFHYQQILETRGTSAPKGWRMDVPNTVTTFSFSVYVETQVEAEQGILRWEREHGSATTTSTLWDIWGSSATNIFAVGDGGVYHYDGSGWFAMPGSTGPNLHAVWGIDRYNVFAAGESGRILKYDGNRWSAVAPASERRILYSVWGDGATDVYAAGRQRNPSTFQEEGVILRSTDVGATWTVTTFPYGGYRQLNALWASSGTDVHAVGYQNNPLTGFDEGLLLRSTDGGATWSESASTHTSHRRFRSVWGSSATDLYAVGHQVNPSTGLDEGLILRSTDGGASWTMTISTHTRRRELFHVWGTGAADVYAVGSQANEATGRGESLLLHSTDGGVTWTEEVTSGPFPRSLWGSGAGDLRAVGGHHNPDTGGTTAAILRREGTSWIAESIGRSGTLYGVWNADASTAVAVGSWYNPGTAKIEGRILRSTDGGASWIVGASPDTKHRYLYSVWGRSATELYAVGHNEDPPYGGEALILRSTDGGASWSESEFPANNRHYHSVWGSGASHVYVVGYERSSAVNRDVGLIVRSTDGGATWSETTYPALARRELHGVWGSSATDVYSVGLQRNTSTNLYEGVILHSTNGGASWTETIFPHTSSRHLYSVWGSSATDVWVVGDQGNPVTGLREAVILHSTDGGTTWSESTFPSTKSVSLRSVSGSSATDVYASGLGGANGLILRYDGTSWSEMTIGTRGTLFGVAIQSPTHGLAVGAVSVVLRGTR